MRRFGFSRAAGGGLVVALGRLGRCRWRPGGSVAAVQRPGWTIIYALESERVAGTNRTSSSDAGRRLSAVQGFTPGGGSVSTCRSSRLRAVDCDLAVMRPPRQLTTFVLPALGMRPLTLPASWPLRSWSATASPVRRARSASVNGSASGAAASSGYWSRAASGRGRQQRAGADALAADPRAA